MVAVDVLAELVDRIARDVAAGEAMIEVPAGKARVAAAFLISRGHVARIGNQLRPIRDGELL